MRHGLVLVVALAFGGIVRAEPGKALELSVGQELQAPEGVAVKFIAVTADSRCPKGAHCGWAGDATVEVGLTEKGSTHKVVLVTDPEAKRSAEAGGFRVVLESLQPDPPPEGVKAADYRLRVSVTKAGEAPKK